MRVGIVHTAGSPCRCAESISKGLHELRHEVLLVHSEEIEIQALRLADECDLVIDHTDTYCGRGLYRPIVRLLLENWGARIVGSSARACFVADNKAAAKQRLAEAGIPVPPGIVVHSNTWTIPPWLKPPFIIKPAFEHMSRGIHIAHTEQDAYEAAARLLQSLGQPLLIEKFIKGRELAVSLLESENLQVLPILEWSAGGDEAGILTEEFKLLDRTDTREIRQPRLSEGLSQRIEDMARRAFGVLELRDYGRFDIRLSPGGEVFFLEANTTPSFEPLEAFAVSAAWQGLSYSSLIEHLLRAARRRYQHHHKRVSFALTAGPVELEIIEGVPCPPPSTVELASLIDIREGEEALELGCGSGLISIALAKNGAGRVAATDVDTRALQITMKNAQNSGVLDRVDLFAGSWFSALGETGNPLRLFDVIVATPPQTPGPAHFGPKYGGPDGLAHIETILRNAPRFLHPERGRLWLLAISLADPKELRNLLRKYFAEITLVRETLRPFTAEEYDGLHNGLFAYLCTLRASGRAEFIDEATGGYTFRNMFIRASKPKRP